MLCTKTYTFFCAHVIYSLDYDFEMLCLDECHVSMTSNTAHEIASKIVSTCFITSSQLIVCVCVWCVCVFGVCVCVCVFGVCVCLVYGVCVCVWCVCALQHQDHERKEIKGIGIF